MNFYQHQDAARKKTTLLVVLMCVAVLCLIAVTVFVVGVFLYFLQTHSTSVGAVQAQATSFSAHFQQLVRSPVTGWITLGVVFVVAAGIFYKHLCLGRGGAQVALALGGRRVDPATDNLDERRALNVVEEMAIASGNPVPPLYLLEEEGINAFAAGLSRRDAVIGLTRACIEKLSRDELQGVVAHEFSHIHNGDMRLNLRLVALLHGILLIGLIGRAIAEGSRSGRSRDKSASLGYALMLIGYGGTFFGNVIKAAVSRQREFLADASAVQFTRNPLGIGGALQKIATHVGGSELRHPRSAEFSHMYFGQGLRLFWGGLMATHPPLSERIKRIAPRGLPEVAPRSGATRAAAAVETAGSASGLRDILDIADVGVAIAAAGEASSATLAVSREVIGTLPQPLKEAAHQAFSARALIYGMLLHRDSALRAAQLEDLRRQAHPATYRELERLLKVITRLPRLHLLTLFHMALPALKLQSEAQLRVFRNNLERLLAETPRNEIFLWCLGRALLLHVLGLRNTGSATLAQRVNAAQYLCYAIACEGDNSDLLEAFNRGWQALGQAPLAALPFTKLDFGLLDQSLSKLEQLHALEKPKLLKAVLAVVQADGRVTREEEEMLRVLADSLDCPLPPAYTEKKN